MMKHSTYCACDFHYYKFLIYTHAELFEYTRDGWSFHGKGIWLYNTKESDHLQDKPQENSSLPFATFIGSPNFGWYKFLFLLLSFLIL